MRISLGGSLKKDSRNMLVTSFLGVYTEKYVFICNSAFVTCVCFLWVFYEDCGILIISMNYSLISRVFRSRVIGSDQGTMPVLTGQPWGRAAA